MPDPRRKVSAESLPSGTWRQARKSQICGAEQINDKDNFTVTTPWGAELTGARGDYLLWDENNPRDRWVVNRGIFNSSYQEFEPGRFQKTALTDVQQITEALAVETAEGVVDGNSGDYLARGLAGELWVIPAAFFAKAYKFVS